MPKQEHVKEQRPLLTRIANGGLVLALVAYAGLVYYTLIMSN